MSLTYAMRYASCIGALVLANPLQPRSSSDLADRSIQLHSKWDHLVRDLNSTSRSNKSTTALKSNSDTILPPHPPSILQALASNLTSASNGSVPSFNVISDNRVHIQCDGASYGFDLDILDCEQAKAEIPANAEEFQWAERHTKWQKEIFALPYRSMGDKASCYVQTVLIGNAGSAKASLNQVRNAAASIRHKCASGGKLRGGIATNIGGDHNLAVIMGGYQPTSEIRCGGRISLLTTSCEDVLEDMPATTENEVFGPATDPTSQVLLPHIVQSANTPCRLQIIASSGSSDTTSWYQLWEAATALWSACLRQDLSGGLSGLGENGKLLVTMNVLAGSTSLLKGPSTLRRVKWYGTAPAQFKENDHGFGGKNVTIKVLGR